MKHPTLAAPAPQDPTPPPEPARTPAETNPLAALSQQLRDRQVAFARGAAVAAQGALQLAAKDEDAARSAASRLCEALEAALALVHAPALELGWVWRPDSATWTEALELAQGEFYATRDGAEDEARRNGFSQSFVTACVVARGAGRHVLLTAERAFCHLVPRSEEVADDR